jgi:hypothetical protein
VLLLLLLLLLAVLLVVPELVLAVRARIGGTV